MSTTSERLRDLEMADFDTFGEQDQGPGEWPLATPEEVNATREEVFESPWTDPARLPECLGIAFAALGEIAIGDNPAAYQATQALRRMLQRTKFGGPLEDMARGEFV